MKKVVTISFDFELAWGVVDSPLWREREKAGVYTRLREIFPELLGLFSACEIPATWAIVGAMLESSKEEVGIDHLPADYAKAIRYFLDNCQESSWNALDLVEQLRSHASLVDFASHTYSHIYPSFPSCNKVNYLKDVGKSLDVLKSKLNVDCNSLIFPRDQADFRKGVSEQYGLNYRLNPDFGRAGGTLQRYKRAVGRLVSGNDGARVYYAGNDCLAHLGSEYFNWVGGRFSTLKRVGVERFVNSFKVNSLRSDTGIVYHHVWLHPFNLSEDKKVFSLFCDWLKAMKESADDGYVEFLTMSDINHRLGSLEFGNV